MPAKKKKQSLFAQHAEEQRKSKQKVTIHSEHSPFPSSTVRDCLWSPGSYSLLTSHLNAQRTDTIEPTKTLMPWQTGIDRIELAAGQPARSTWYL